MKPVLLWPSVKKIVITLAIMFLVSCDWSVCSGNVIDDQVDPPNTDNSVICGVVVE